MADIVLATLNAKYIHTSLGLRYLFANLKELQPRAAIREFDIGQRTLDVAEALLSENPRVIGFGVYIWNIRETRVLVEALKKIAPNVTVILGGPEVSYEYENEPCVAAADFLITHEADVAFYEVCAQIFQNEKPTRKIINPPRPELLQLELPYDFYSAKDVEHRVVYVEASRGCPFSCEFCLSSLDEKVRPFELEKFLSEMQKLLDRGLQHFKFVDRTFNLSIDTSRRILSFFLERYKPGLFVHFEMIPDRLPSALKEIISQFPRGALQFEVGVQTLTPSVETNISRRQNHERMQENFKFLNESNSVHVHADLIVGLPGETFETLANSFNALHAMQPEEIQVGILKRLKGTPIGRHDASFEMVYSKEAPYELIQNKNLSFVLMQRMKRFARYWDIFSNRGHFSHSMKAILKCEETPFHSFLYFSDWVSQKEGRTSGISLLRQYECIFQFRVDVLKENPSVAANELMVDYKCEGRNDIPRWLKAHLSPASEIVENAPAVLTNLLSRQARHLAHTDN